MEAYFSGRKELFEGLAMESLEKDWTEYPVLHLDLTGSRYTSVSDLIEKLDQHLCAWENIYGIEEKRNDPSARFSDVIDNACNKTGQKVVILIDEYEKPIIDNIDNPELMSEKKLAIVLGTEGEGLRNSTISSCDYTVKIPMSHGVDSLNVAAASAVAFWQLGNH